MKFWTLGSIIDCFLCYDLVALMLILCQPCFEHPFSEAFGMRKKGTFLRPLQFGICLLCFLYGVWWYGMSGKVIQPHQSRICDSASTMFEGKSKLFHPKFTIATHTHVCCGRCWQVHELHSQPNAQYAQLSFFQHQFSRIVHYFKSFGATSHPCRGYGLHEVLFA